MGANCAAQLRRVDRSCQASTVHMRQHLGHRVVANPNQMNCMQGASQRRCSTAPSGLDASCKATLSEQKSAASRDSAAPQEADNALFDWHRQWYAVAVADDLATDRPHPVVALGKDLVVWQDGDGKWRAFEDKCPHRGVPLSEGRLETDGTLQCSYHGWRFTGEGKCTTVPQALTPEAEAKAAAMPRACAKTFPTEVKDGLLFVWMHSGPEAYIESAMTPVEWYQGEEGQERVSSPWIARDMPMQWEMLVENLTDPAHLPFSHHGLGGLNRANPSRPTYDTETAFDKQSFATVGTFAKFAGNFRQAATDVRMPSACKQIFLQPVMTDEQKAELEACDSDEATDALLARVATSTSMLLNMHAVPVTHGQSRLFFRIEAPGVHGTPMARTMERRPVWRDHLLRLEVLDGDLVFLHRQSQHVTNGRLSGADYYLPAPADLPIRSLWKWMRAYSPNGIDYYPDVRLPVDNDNTLPREQLLDRYQQHVKGCKACSGALENVRRGIIAAQAAMAAAFLGLAYLFGIGQPVLSVPPVATLVLGVAACITWLKLRVLQGKFVYTDYVHAEH